MKMNTDYKEELQKLRAEFDLFKQKTEKNIFSNLIVFFKKVLFNGDVKTMRSGAEVNLVPTYVEVSAGLSTTTIGTSSWEDWDLSSVVPVGALYADIAIVNRADSEFVAGVRKNGGTTNRYRYLPNDSSIMYTVVLDSGRIIERYCSDNGSTNFAVMGYYI